MSWKADCTTGLVGEVSKLFSEFQIDFSVKYNLHNYVNHKCQAQNSYNKGIGLPCLEYVGNGPTRNAEVDRTCTKDSCGQCQYL